MYVPIFADQLPLQPLLNEIKVPARRSNKVAGLRQARDRAIIQDDSTLIAHQRVADLVDAQLRKSMRVDEVEQLARIPAAHI